MKNKFDMRFAGKFLKYGSLTLGIAVSVGTIASFKSNRYSVDSIGIVRFGRASLTAISIVSYYKNSLYAANLDPRSDAYKELRSKVHKKSAEKLLELCRLNKGVYIKVGQHIGALDYLLPPEYVETMRVLHSNAPASTIQEVYRVFKEDLNKDPEDVFESIDPLPLGAASLAQVHKARLKDGRTVALKVQHPSVKGNSIVDMTTMEYLAKFAAWVLPDFKVQWLVDETKRNIPKELDFQMEAENTEKAREMFGHVTWLKIPSVHWDLCSARVLALEYVEGGQVNDANYMQKNGINPFEISDKLGKLYSEMIFKKGFVHSDPHPGNILVRKNAEGNADIVLLDHGLYATLTDDFRLEYAQVWLSILNRDMPGLKKHCKALGVPDLYWLFASMVSGRSWDAIQAGVVSTKFDDKEKELFQKEVPYLLTFISDVLSTVNRQMFLIFKTNDLLRSIEYTLKTHSRMESFSMMSRSCVETVYTDRKNRCGTKTALFRLYCSEKWTLFKLSLYYNYLRIRSYLHFL